MKLTLILLLLFTPLVIFSQSIQKIVVVDNNVDPGGMLDEITLPPAIVEGSLYYNDEWLQGKVYLNSGQLIINYPIRYDVENNTIEIRTGNSIRVCEWSQYSHFEWKENSSFDSLFFINTNHFIYEDGVPPIGTFRKIYDGKVKLFAKPYIKILKSNYAPTVDIGSRNHKAVQRENYYLYFEGFVKEFQNRKELLSIIAEYRSPVENFLQQKKLKINREEDLVKIIKYLDSLQFKN